MPMKDVRSYCLATCYRSGSQLKGALQLLINMNVLRQNGDYLEPDQDFLYFVKEDVTFAISARLVDCLLAAGELEDLFPPGALSWGNVKGELNVHLSRIRITHLAVIKLFRDLNAIVDSEESTVLLKIKEPLSGKVQAAIGIAFNRRRRIKSLSPEQLESLQQAQSKQGADAEEYILGLERTRLSEHPQLQLVQRVSLTDTGAGYDITSFEGLKSFLPDRFIEVKSYKGSERFFLSLGELETARELGDRYYLCLVDMEKMEVAGYVPDMIKNPAVELFGENSDWSAVAVTFEVLRKSPIERTH